MTSCARGCAPSRHARQAGPPRHSPKARGGSAIFRRLGRRAHCRRGRRFAAHTPKASPCRGRSLQDWCLGAPPGSVSALPRAGTPGAPRPQPPALCSRGGPATTPPSLGTAGRPGPGRRGRGARLAVGADRRRGRERERALQDVLERRVALRAPEGREAVQQLVHQDPKAPPAAASTRRCLSWSRCLGMPLHPGVPAEACLGRSKVFSGRTCTWQQRPARLTEQLLCTSTRPSMHAACMLADRKPAVHEATPAHGPPTTFDAVGHKHQNSSPCMLADGRPAARGAAPVHGRGVADAVDDLGRQVLLRAHERVGAPLRHRHQRHLLRRELLRPG